MTGLIWQTAIFNDQDTFKKISCKYRQISPIFWGYKGRQAGRILVVPGNKLKLQNKFIVSRLPARGTANEQITNK
jgi:hypothetical protein